MPTKEQLKMWAEQVLGFAADAQVSGAGTVVSLGSGAPDMTCSYLITLCNQKLLEITYATALSATPAQLAAARNIQDLKARIEAACDNTPDPETPESEPPIDTKPEPESDPPPEPDPDPAADPVTATPDPVSQTGTPAPSIPTPPSAQELCCKAHGNALPQLDDSGFTARRAGTTLVLGGKIKLSHPCGLSAILYDAVAYDRTGTRVPLDRRRIAPAPDRTEIELDIRRKTPLRGMLGGHLYVQATSTCGRTLHATISPYGTTWTRPRD